MREGNIMTAKRNAATNIPAERKPPASDARAPTHRRRRKFVAAVLGLAALATVGALAVVGTFVGHAAGLTNRATAPSTSGTPAARTPASPPGTTPLSRQTQAA